MNLTLTPEMTYESITEVLKNEFPECEVALKKNPIARFQYIEVRKTAFVGVWIRIMEKKNRVNLAGAIPSAWARGLLGGLLLLAFTYKSRKNITNEVAEILKDEYKTEVQ